MEIRDRKAAQRRRASWPAGVCRRQKERRPMQPSVPAFWPCPASKRQRTCCSTLLWRGGGSCCAGRAGGPAGQNGGLSGLWGTLYPDRRRAGAGRLGGGAYGIRTPALERAALIRPEALDLVLVPCTAFDAACRRVGMGKGYYDRYLPRCRNAVTLGVAFEAQRVPEAAADEQDRRLDGFVTERKVYRGTDKFEL